MSFLVNARKKFRKYIFPEESLKSLLKDQKPQRVLDVGAGTGFFLEVLDKNNLLAEAYGVEVNPQFFRKLNDRIEINSEENASGQFDLIIFNDVLHHVKDKQAFLNHYVTKYLQPNGHVLVKDMNPKNPIYKYWNRLHDLIFAGEKISEISPKELKQTIPNNLTQQTYGEERIFLYDHYFFLFQNTNTENPSKEI